MIIKSKAGTEIAKNGYTVIDELNQIPMIKTNYLQLEHNHINPIILGSKAFEHKDIFINVVEDTETSGDTAFKEYNAIHEFAWVLSGMRKHDSYTGYLSLEQYLTMVLEGTDFTYQVEGGHQYYALQFENLGDGESHLDMFFKMLNRWNTEFELRGKKVYITHQRGRLRDKHVGRYKMNIIDTIINSDITDGATAVWGYFGKKDEENPENSTYREFYWQIDELVEQYGIRYAKPYSNENITQEETMIEYLNNILLDSWKISTEVDIADITDEVVQTGDEYVAVDERLGITLNTRIQKLESVYDADDKLLYQTATLGTVSFASAASGSSSQLQEVIEKVKKDYNDRITDLKQEFDNRFNDEVTQIEIDFTELVNGVRQEIQADQERMENEMSQMKLTQQQRVSEIYEDIGGINQTVSDVANKADYLDGVYTDLSTQTGEVSSTVANIIDGKAPTGSVLKQTIDGVVGRVWQTDIDKLKVDSRNLLMNTDFKQLPPVNEIQNYDYVLSNGRLRINPTSNYVIGNAIKFNLTKDIQPNSNMTISFVANTFSSLCNVRFKVSYGTYTNFVQVAKVAGTDTQFNLTFNVGDFPSRNANNWLWVEFTRGLFIMPNSLVITESDKAVNWTPAPEDLMKYTDIVARPDGFMLGTFEMGGDKIAQAIVGKAGAIDLIADNVNLSNNLNVANQIKSLSLETVYANISELRTRLLVADVITADMLKADTAMFEKFTSSTAFIGSLFTKSATISEVQSIDLNAQRIKGGVLTSNTSSIEFDLDNSVFNYKTGAKTNYYGAANIQFHTMQNSLFAEMNGTTAFLNFMNSINSKIPAVVIGASENGTSAGFKSFVGMKAQSSKATPLGLSQLELIGDRIVIDGHGGEIATGAWIIDGYKEKDPIRSIYGSQQDVGYQYNLGRLSNPFEKIYVRHITDGLRVIYNSDTGDTTLMSRDLRNGILYSNSGLQFVYGGETYQFGYLLSELKKLTEYDTAIQKRIDSTNERIDVVNNRIDKLVGK